LAKTKAAPKVLPSCALIGLHSAISPSPRTVREKSHVSLDLHPVRSLGEDCYGGQVYRKSAAHNREWLIHGGINLRARQTAIIGVEKDIETAGRAGTHVQSIGVYRLHIPSLTCGNNEIVGEIGTKLGDISERRGQSTND
jgi:hypothetical protein